MLRTKVRTFGSVPDTKCTGAGDGWYQSRKQRHNSIWQYAKERSKSTLLYLIDELRLKCVDALFCKRTLLSYCAYPRLYAWSSCQITNMSSKGSKRWQVLDRDDSNMSKWHAPMCDLLDQTHIYHLIILFYIAIIMIFILYILVPSRP